MFRKILLSRWTNQIRDVTSDSVDSFLWLDALRYSLSLHYHFGWSSELRFALDVHYQAGDDSLQSEASFLFQLCVHVFIRFERVPLSDGSPRTGQHVLPVPLLCPTAVHSHQDLPNGVVLTDLIVVQHGHDDLNFLWKSMKHTVNITDLKQSVINSGLSTWICSEETSKLNDSL